MRFHTQEFKFKGVNRLLFSSRRFVREREGGSSTVFRLGHFPLGCPWLKDECLTRIEMSSRKRKLHTKHNIEKRGEGMARADSASRRRARPGERKLPLPKKYGNGSFPGI